MTYTNLFTEYATCAYCGYKKLCMLKDRRYICRACDRIQKEMK